jgi:hypothetical protein
MDSGPGSNADGGIVAESGITTDAGMPVDAGNASDAGQVGNPDSGNLLDAGPPADAGSPIPELDGGVGMDAAAPSDAGTAMGLDAGLDAGMDGGAPDAGKAFPYDPLNFPQTENPAPLPGTTSVACGGAYIDSTNGTAYFCGTTYTTPTFAEHVDLPTDDKGYVVHLESLVVLSGGTITILGNKPVILAVWGNATIQGVLDASSNRVDAQLGAGANFGGCGSGNGGTGSSHSEGGPGGGGGAYGTIGGKGGNGANGLANGAAGGGSNGAGTPPPLRGGCFGGKGGFGVAGNFGGSPGQGGVPVTWRWPTCSPSTLQIFPPAAEAAQGVEINPAVEEAEVAAASGSAPAPW